MLTSLRSRNPPAPATGPSAAQNMASSCPGAGPGAKVGSQRGASAAAISDHPSSEHPNPLRPWGRPQTRRRPDRQTQCGRGHLLKPEAQGRRTRRRGRRLAAGRVPGASPTLRGSVSRERVTHRDTGAPGAGRGLEGSRAGWRHETREGRPGLWLRGARPGSGAARSGPGSAPTHGCELWVSIVTPPQDGHGGRRLSVTSGERGRPGPGHH